MNDVLLTPIRLNEFKVLIQNSVERAIKAQQIKQVEHVIQSEQLLTIDEVAELLHLTKPTIYSKHSKGELPGVCKRGKRLYFQRDIIIDWLKEGRTNSNAEIESDASEYLIKKKGLNYGK